MSVAGLFHWLFGESETLTSAEEARLSGLLTLYTCPNCHSHNMIGVAPSKTPGNSDYICHVCGEGWETAPNGDDTVRAVRPLGVVIASYNAAFKAGDHSDKHRPYDD